MLKLRLVIATALVLFSVGTARAQGSLLQCQTNVSSTPTLPSEAYTGQTGDIALFCIGGANQTVGSALPQATIQLFYNTAVTSRLFGSSGVSEALLIVDDPGSGVGSYYGSTGASNPGRFFGSNASQSLCPTPATGCGAFVQSIVPTDGPFAGTPLTVASTSAGAAIPGPNVYQGIVVGNTVTFNGIPILAPVTAGAVRVLRITNVRVNATSLSGGGATPVIASISISGVSMPPSDPAPTVGFVQSGLSTSATASTSLGQCASQTKTAVNVLSFSETFPTAFKTRIFAQSNVAFAGQGQPGFGGLANQNVPGSINNSESDFVFGVGASQTAGLTDFGTRLRAVFNNIPAGVRIFVSVANVNSAASAATPPAVIGGSVQTAPYALLVNGETVSDDSAGVGAFPSVAATTTAPNGGTVPVAELAVASGSATAIWEVVNASQNSVESLKFAVYATYVSNVGANSPPPGTATVNLSFAAAPPAFSASAAAAASSSLVIPRFIADPNAARNILTINTCALPTPSVSINAPAAAYGTAAPVSVNVTSGSGTPTGTVGLSVDGGAAIVQALSVGAAAFSLSGLSAASHNLTATYSGDASFAAAIQNGALTINKSTLTVTANNASKVFGAPLPPFTVSLSGFVNGDTPAAVSGTAGFSTPATASSPVGNYAILPSAGTLAAANYTFAFANGTLSVAKANTATSLALGSGMAATVVVLSPGAGTPTGLVQFTSGATPLGTASLVGSTATLAVTPPKAVTATYSGDGNFNGSSAVVVVPAASPTSSMSLTSSANPSALGQSVTFSASVTTDGPPGSPTGTVQFFDGAKSLGSSALSGAGQASVTTTTLTAGQHTISATYSGDATFPGAQASITQIVTSSLSVTVTAAPASPVVGQTVTLAATVTPASIPPGFSGPTGQVDFLEGGFTIGSATLASGVATVGLNNLALGAHTITALYRGDSTWSSAFKAITVTVSQAASATALSVAISSANQVTLKADVSAVAPASGAPTGTVRFVDTSNNALVATAALSGGSATAPVGALSATRPLAAIYSGDANFAGSTSAPLPVSRAALACRHPPSLPMRR
jgi:hypothetical protein